MNAVVLAVEGRGHGNALAQLERLAGGSAAAVGWLVVLLLCPFGLTAAASAMGPLDEGEWEGGDAVALRFRDGSLGEGLARSLVIDLDGARKRLCLLALSDHGVRGGVLVGGKALEIALAVKAGRGGSSGEGDVGRNGEADGRDEPGFGD